jgi:predicted secreted protein
MSAYKVATRIDDSGEIRLSELPFAAGQEVEIIILSRDPETRTTVPAALAEPLPPVTQRLLGIARGVGEEDYHRYLEEKHR